MDFKCDELISEKTDADSRALTLRNQLLDLFSQKMCKSPSNQTDALGAGQYMDVGCSELLRKEPGADHSASAQKMAGVTIRVRPIWPRCNNPARRSPVTR